MAEHRDSDTDPGEEPGDRGGDSANLLPDADPAPTSASKYATAEEEVVTREDRDPDDTSD